MKITKMSLYEELERITRILCASRIDINDQIDELEYFRSYLSKILGQISDFRKAEHEKREERKRWKRR